jgi:hypothetical protein
MRDQWDWDQYTDPRVKYGKIFAPFVEGLLGQQVLSDRKLAANATVTKEMKCFVMAKGGSREYHQEVVSTAYVLEGEGCYFLQSPSGQVVYDQEQIAKYNINKEHLEAYVKAHMCPE